MVFFSIIYITVVNLSNVQSVTMQIVQPLYERNKRTIRLLNHHFIASGNIDNEQ